MEVKVKWDKMLHRFTKDLESARLAQYLALIR